MNAGTPAAAGADSTPDYRFARRCAGIHARLLAHDVARPGPGSVSWKINRQIVVVAGWGRAMLLQFTHPLVAAGIDAHSGFRASVPARITRVRSTIGAMLSLTFGDDDEAAATAAGIRAIHDRVSGRLDDAAGPFPAGATYSANDAELLRWVHATLLDSIPLVYERLVGPLTADERDRYCAEASVMEPLLDIPAGSLPRTTAALDGYVHDILSRTVTVTARSRALAHAVLFPPGWRLLWPVFRPVQLVTIGLLPDTVRRAYGFTWTADDERALTRWAAAIRGTGRVLPRALTTWPMARRRRRARPHSSPSRRTLTPA